MARIRTARLESITNIVYSLFQAIPSFLSARKFGQALCYDAFAHAKTSHDTTIAVPGSFG
jgi:hypothetical protein